MGGVIAGLGIMTGQDCRMEGMDNNRQLDKWMDELKDGEIDRQMDKWQMD